MARIVGSLIMAQRKVGLRRPRFNVSVDGGFNGSKIVRGTAMDVESTVSLRRFLDLAVFIDPHKVLCGLLGRWHWRTLGLSFVHAESTLPFFGRLEDLSRVQVC